MGTFGQQTFDWFGERTTERPVAQPVAPDVPGPTAPSLEFLAAPRLPTFDTVPLAKPLPSAIEQGVFGTTTDGSIVPDEEAVQAITMEQATELTALLADLQTVDDAIRTGEDPRTGRVPRTPEGQSKLREYLERESPRFKVAYAETLGAYADAFGGEAAERLDLWVRKTVADCTIAPTHHYDPGHPWHYYHEGDNAPPIPVDDIEGDLDAGTYLERDLPKNRAKRLAKMQLLLATERARVEEDKRRYQDIVERGAEALSRYDREIAHTCDAMARASALSLKFNHLRWGLGRVAWLEDRLGLRAKDIFE